MKVSSVRPVFIQTVSRGQQTGGSTCPGLFGCRGNGTLSVSLSAQPLQEQLDWMQAHLRDDQTATGSSVCLIRPMSLQIRLTGVYVKATFLCQ